MQALNVEELRGALAVIETEGRICEEFARRKAEAFGRDIVRLDRRDPRYERVINEMQALTENFPVSPHGSRFIGSEVTVKVFLYVNVSHFDNTYKKNTDPKKLFLEVVGKEIDFGPLHSKKLGYFTRDNITLKVKNLRQKQGAKFKPNKHANARALLPNAVALGGKVHGGAISTDPALMKTKFVADVAFGDILNEINMELTVETCGEHENTYLVIPLNKFTTTSKIPPDGTFTAASGVRSYIELFEGDNQLWIDCKETISIKFPL